MEVSIIMSVYNGGRFIERSINSIISQTFKNYEFIIVDDGSTDNSLELIQKIANDDKRIRIIKNRRKIGLTKSLNKAIKYSKGIYIARQDADDISFSNRLRKQVEFLNQNKDYAFCGTDIIKKQDRNFNLKFFKYKDIKKNLIIGNYFIHSSIVIRKKIFDNYGLYDENWLYGQDYELWCRLIYKYHLKALNLPDKLLIMNMPKLKYSQKNIKYLIQQMNYVKTRLVYIKYSDSIYSNLRALFEIVKNILELFLILFYKILISKFKK